MSKAVTVLYQGWWWKQFSPFFRGLLIFSLLVTHCALYIQFVLPNLAKNLERKYAWKFFNLLMCSFKFNMLSFDNLANVHKYVLDYSRPFERWLVPVTTSHPHSYVSRLWHEGTYIQWGTGSIRKFHRLAKIWWLKCDAMQRYADAATAHKSPDSWVADYGNKWLRS